MNEYSVKNGTIYTENGLPWVPRWFCDNRMAFSVDDESIRQIDYHGPRVKGSYILFRKRFWEGMRFYLRKGNSRILLRPQKCEILPFGFFSEGEYGKYGLYTADDVLYFTVTPAFDAEVEVEFYEDSVFRPETHATAGVGLRGKERAWTPFSLSNGALCASFEEAGEKMHVSFSSSQTLSYRKTERFVKHVLTLSEVKKGEEATLSFSASAEEPKGCEGYAEALLKQRARYCAVTEKAPVLHSAFPLVDQFFATAPTYHESLKITDAPGGTRAQTTHYFMWAWDSMTTPYAYLYWGDKESIGNMLALFEEKAKAIGGIPDAFNPDFTSTYGVAPTAAQGMYVTLLDLYRLAGGDYTARYAFAKEQMDKILATELGASGLIRGFSLYPDFRDLIGETGNDISAFNNSVAFCAARSMEALAKAHGDRETENACRAFAQRTVAHFDKALWCDEAGYYASSADAEGLTLRPIPSSNAIKYENDYCEELTCKHTEALMKFFEEHFVAPAGLRPYPEWCPCYDADANQLHSYWPVMSELFVRLIGQTGNKNLMRTFIRWLEYWSERLNCPEGISVYENTPTPAFDAWSAAPGIWHGYSARGFYTAVIHGLVGVTFCEKGLRFLPVALSEPVSVENLHFGDTAFDIESEGCGMPKKVLLNGETLETLDYIPFERLRKHNVLKITR